MTIPTGTGEASFSLGSTLGIINAGSAAKSMREAGKSPHEFEGIANSFIYRPRGPQSSEGWFLVNRHDLERWFPSMLGEGFLSSSQEDTYKDYAWNRGLDATLYIKNNPASFGTVDPAAQTDIAIPIIIESAYCITGVPKPDAYTYPAWGLERSKFSDQENASTNAWDMQLCVIHVVDERWYAQKSDSMSIVEHFLPRRFLLDGESFAAADEINYGSTLPEQTSAPYGYENLINHLTHVTHESRGYYDTTHSDADYPTLCRNYGLVGLNNYRCLWEILDEISHTLVYDLVDKTPSTIGLSVVPKGSDNATTLSERNTYKNLHLLAEISNDVRPKRGNNYYTVAFPLETGNHGYPAVAYQPGGATAYVENVLATHRPTYLYVHVQVTYYGISGNESISGYNVSVSDMVSLYGSYNSPKTLYTSPLELKGRLLVRNKLGEVGNRLNDSRWTSFGSSSVECTNSAEIITHAKKLAVLRAKQDHFESRNKVIIDETYIGFLKFSATKDLSAIIWSDLGDGATTRIINRPFEEDRDPRSSSPPNFPAPPRVENIHINEFPPSNFNDDLRQMVYPLGGTSYPYTGTDYFAEGSTFNAQLGRYRVGVIDGSGYAGWGLIEVKNKSKIPIISASQALGGGGASTVAGGEVEIFWNRYEEEWQSMHYPASLLVNISDGKIYYVNPGTGAYVSTGVSASSFIRGSVSGATYGVFTRIGGSGPTYVAGGGFTP